MRPCVCHFFCHLFDYQPVSPALKALRPQVEEAVQELIRQQGKPANFTGTLEYHGFTIAITA